MTEKFTWRGIEFSEPTTFRDAIVFDCEKLHGIYCAEISIVDDHPMDYRAHYVSLGHGAAPTPQQALDAAAADAKATLLKWAAEIPWAGDE